MEYITIVCRTLYHWTWPQNMTYNMWYNSQVTSLVMESELAVECNNVQRKETIAVVELWAYDPV